MSDSAQSNDHQSLPTSGGRPRHARWQSGKRSLLAALLGVVAFIVLLAYTAFGADAITQTSGPHQISAKSLLGHECDDTEWHFVINQIDVVAHAPATIHVTWANGQSEDVPLAKFTGGVAHYVTTANLDSVVTSATATIYGGWSGQFNLSHGPCGTPSTSSSSSSPPPSTSSSESSPPPSDSSSESSPPPPSDSSSSSS
jgi:hypothetical protein